MIGHNQHRQMFKGNMARHMIHQPIDFGFKAGTDVVNGEEKPTPGHRWTRRLASARRSVGSAV